MVDLFNPHSSEWLINKFEIYKDLRNRETAYWSEKYQMYVLSRYDDVLVSLKNPDIFSSANGNLIVEMPHRFGSTLGASDNPKHNFYKNIVKNSYSKLRILDVSQKVKVRLEKEFTLIQHNKIINISQLIETISAYTTAEILGLPIDKMFVENLIIDIQKKSSRAVLTNTDDTSYNTFLSTVKDLIANDTAPTYDGIYKDFIENNVKKYPIYSLFTGPVLSGTSSMTGALEFLTLDLFRENQLELILKDRSLIDNAINESLRFHASTGRFSRTVTMETHMHGVTLQPGTRVAVCLDSANRDNGKFLNPDSFDLYRDTSGHLGFGHGVHACIALAVSKVIMSIYLNWLLDKFKNYKIVTDLSNFNYVITQSGNDDMIDNLMIEKINE